MGKDLIGKLRRAAGKPPAYLARRLLQEVVKVSDRWRAPARARALTPRRLARLLGFPDLASAWSALVQRPYPFLPALTSDQLDRLEPGETRRILADAEAALAHRVDLLGSGPVELGPVIDWSVDFKTGRRWPPAYCHAIEYANLDEPSDVKLPWELSRLQWLIPAGQAYVLTGDERYARGVRDVIEQWISANPYAWTVNWSCTMEAALRIVSLTWLMRACAGSASFGDPAFRAMFLKSLVEHADFTDRYIERSDINGNHYTADAAGLVFAGLFLGDGPAAQRWFKTGWEILGEEIQRQVYSDGVDFEGSTPYHRLVSELFLLPALYGQALGHDLPDVWRSRLLAMAGFTAAYSRQDGGVPIWGDNDDARALPMAGKALYDHRYLIAWTALGLAEPDLLSDFGGPVAEVIWLMGAAAAGSLRRTRRRPRRSEAFTEGGFYVLADDRNHVFVDCGPVGLAGRGGHGHNDILSFEAALDGRLLVVDPGSYVYTASPAERNAFRATASHNTPQIAGHELNRFTGPQDLWTLHFDASPEILSWEAGTDRTVLVMTHSGYDRLAPSVRPVRRIALDHFANRLLVEDWFEGGGQPVTVPLHLASGVEVELAKPTGTVVLIADDRRFILRWEGEGHWTLSTQSARQAPSYGVTEPIQKFVWSAATTAGAKLCVTIEPES